MKKTMIAVTLALGAVAFGTVARADQPIIGDYVEARTASVFAGACHYSGEYVSDGRAAVMAWHFAKGQRDGVSLAGLSALAVVRSDSNLAEPQATRRAAVYVSSAATPAQQTALIALISARSGASLGQIESVTPTKITFTHLANDGYRVAAPGVAQMEVNALPDRACCKQPSLVWYKPLFPIQNRRVGFTQMASVTSRTGGDSWSRSDENGAFYGAFAF